MKIEVTQDDINRGIRSSYCECPIALALQRKLSISDIEVGDTSICVNKIKYRHTDETLDFISEFDEGEYVEPFTFELEIV